MVNSSREEDLTATLKSLETGLPTENKPNGTPTSQHTVPLSCATELLEQVVTS